MLHQPGQAVSCPAPQHSEYNKVKMWEPTKCCCCCDVRTGSIVIGVLILVGGCLGMLGGIQTLTSDKSDLDITCQEFGETSDHCVDELWKIEKSSAISSLVGACFHIIFSSFLLYGILKKKTAFFIPLMVIYVIQIGIMILASVVVIILLMYVGLPFGVVVIYATILGLLIFLETYCLLVIRAYYYQLKREKGHIHTALNDRHLEAPPYPANECPPYPGNEVPPYPTCDVPLYPNQEKFPK